MAAAAAAACSLSQHARTHQAEIARLKAQMAATSISATDAPTQDAVAGGPAAPAAVSAATTALAGPEPEPESAAEDWSWVTKSKCTSASWIGDGAGCLGVYKLVPVRPPPGPYRCPLRAGGGGAGRSV